MSLNHGKRPWNDFQYGNWKYIELVRKEPQMGPKKKAVKKKPAKRRRKPGPWLARDKDDQGCYVILICDTHPTLDTDGEWHGGFITEIKPRLFHGISSIRLRRGQCIEIESIGFKVKKGT